MLLTPQKTPSEEVELPIWAVSGRSIKQPSNNGQAISCFKSLFRADDTGQLWLFLAIQSNNRQTTVKQTPASNPSIELEKLANCGCFWLASQTTVKQRSNRFLLQLPSSEPVILAYCAGLRPCNQTTVKQLSLVEKLAGPVGQICSAPGSNFGVPYNDQP